MEDIYYSAEQVAEMLGLHVKTVQRHIREGLLPASRIGKRWRISARDLSAFTRRQKTLPPQEAEESRVKVSTVLDIRIDRRDEAIRIVNTLTAVLNGKPPEYGASTMTAQFIEPEQMVRIAIWGELGFTRTMLDYVAALTNPEQEGFS